MRLKVLFIATLFIGTYFSMTGQTSLSQMSPALPTATPMSEGMSPERLNRISAMCQKAVEDEDLPGIVALIARNGKIVYHESFGQSNETGQSLRKDDIFRIASQTKAITSTAVMMLWEEARFQMDDPISNYIPEFKDAQVLDTVYADGTYKTVAASKAITIRHLITHTSGIGYGVIDGNPTIKKIYSEAGITDLFTTADIPIGESIKKLAKLPLHHEPGERFTYSEGLDVLGYFIEVISGMPLDQFFKTRIFDPLGMKDTWFYLPESKHDRLVAIQHKENDKWVDFPTTFYDPNYPIKGAKRFFSGGAGLSSTAKDYATFLQMYLNNGVLNGNRLLSRTTIQFMMANQIGEIKMWGGDASHHGLAFSVLNQKGENMGGLGSNGTFEWGGYFNTQYFANPKEQIIGILMKQTQGPVNDQTSWKFKQLVGAAIDN